MLDAERAWNYRPTEAESAKPSCETCASNQPALKEDGTPAGKRCFDPACHGPDSEGSGNHWQQSALSKVESEPSKAEDLPRE